MDDKIHLLLAITDSYIIYCAVTLVSIFENNQDSRFCVHIICPDLKKENKDKLAHLFAHYDHEMSLVRFDLDKFQEIEKVKNRIPGKYHISVFYRLLMAEWLPEYLDRIIYLDSDLIVIDNLRSLWEEKMDDETALCAIPDFVRIKDYHRLEINHLKHLYFNSGVLLINLNYWRLNSVGERYINYICSFAEKLLYPDQDTLNVVLQGKVKYIHQKYNTMSFYFAKEEYLSVRVWYNDMKPIREAIKAPVIIHFASDKPWFKGDYLPYRDEWIRYLSMTEWKDMKIRYNGGYKGRCKSLLRKIVYTFLGKIGNTLYLRYPVSPYSK